MIDATLVSKDANSKLVEVVSLADFDGVDGVDDEDCVGNSLFGHKA